MSGDNQHYLPAALLGGFGVPSASGKRRDALVLPRRKATGNVDPKPTKAEKLAVRKAMYRLIAPPPGVDRDVVDKLWDPVETVLPALVDRLTNRSLQSGDDQLLYAYVAMAAVRHPSFDKIAEAWQKDRGAPPPVGDEIQKMRVEGLHNQLAILSTWRWRVLHVPEDVPRLMITDRGWIYVGEPNRTDHSLFLPMGPTVALLGYLNSPDLPPAKPPFTEHLDLCMSWVEWFNAVAWDDPFIDVLVAHPDDRHLLKNLPDHRDLRVNGYGPYRHRVSSGLMD